MTQEEKDLLLKDLCARLSYQPMCEFIDTEDDFCRTSAKLGYSLRDFIAGKVIIKPYLRPMSNMTEEERMEFTKLFDKWHDDELFDYIEEGIEFSIWKHKGISPVVFDWLNSHHLDYRGLIPKGFALEAPEDMYNTQ